jgi:hypothetical protein
LKLVWPFDRHLKLQLIHEPSLADAEVTTEKLLLEGRDLGTDVAILIIPLVDGRVGEVVGHVSVVAGLTDGVIDRLAVDPPSFPGALSERGGLGLGECSSKRSHVESVCVSVSRLSCSVVAEAGLGSAAVVGGVSLPGSHGCVCVVDLMDQSERQCIVGVLELRRNESKALTWCRTRWMLLGRKLVEERRREEADV